MQGQSSRQRWPGFAAHKAQSARKAGILTSRMLPVPRGHLIEVLLVLLLLVLLRPLGFGGCCFHGRRGLGSRRALLLPPRHAFRTIRRVGDRPSRALSNIRHCAIGLLLIGSGCSGVWRRRSFRLALLRWRAGCGPLSSPLLLARLLRLPLPRCVPFALISGLRILLLGLRRLRGLLGDPKLRQELVQILQLSRLALLAFFLAELLDGLRL
mmetsp:Transcript_18827/g.71268  ORF Transcript_18827/g.71268 Transcript_18827/m.71268 type:complete len:211 (-) Transcript_18827:807-1439(-)